MERELSEERELLTKRYKLALDFMEELALYEEHQDIVEYVKRLEAERDELRREREQLISMLPRPDLYPRKVSAEEAEGDE